MRSLLTSIACIAALVAAGAGYAKLSEGDRPSNATGAETSKSQGYGLARQADWLRLRFRAKGLYPGQRRWVMARVRNRTPHRLTLRSVRPKVDDARHGCSGYVTVKRRTLKRALAPRSLRRFKLRVAMDPDAIDACQGAKLGVSLRARATLR